MIEIRPHKITDCNISVPGSKSYTHRFLIASSLSDGICNIVNPLKSEDTLLTLSALKALGISIKEEQNKIMISGRSGRFLPCVKPIYLKNSGTSMRLLTAAVSIGDSVYTLTGTKTLCGRPLHDLIAALSQAGVKIRSIDKNGYPPVEISAGKVYGGKVEINCAISSQYLSGLLLLAPYTVNGLDITVTKGPVSKPYIDITTDVIKKMGVSVTRNGYNRFIVKGSQTYRHGTYIVEPDCSHAGYFWAAGAIMGAGVKVKGITKKTCQGDVKFAEALGKMGCKIIYANNGIKVTGHKLHAIKIDMSDMPDMVPTLAVVAAFAKGTTVIENVAQLTVKESNRLKAVASELRKMGINVKTAKDKIAVTGGKPKGSQIDTYDDHRIAMSFAIAGLKTKGVIIKDEKCVEKSFPDFWKLLAKL